MEISYNVEAKVIDTKTGKILAKRRIKGDSFLKNFSAICRLLFMRGDVTDTETVLNTAGSSITLKTGSKTYPFPYFDPAAGNKLRCCIGTSSVAFSRDQYGCISGIATVVYSNYAWTDDGTKKILNIAFSWLNDTGASQNIAEVAMIVTVAEGAAATLHTVAITRDLFSPAITVPAGSTLAVGYTITIPW
jgi:hypothetical protein